MLFSVTTIRVLLFVRVSSIRQFIVLTVLYTVQYMRYVVRSQHWSVERIEINTSCVLNKKRIHYSMLETFARNSESAREPRHSEMECNAN